MGLKEKDSNSMRKCTEDVILRRCDFEDRNDMIEIIIDFVLANDYRLVNIFLREAR